MCFELRLAHVRGACVDAVDTVAGAFAAHVPLSVAGAPHSRIIVLPPVRALDAACQNAAVSFICTSSRTTRRCSVGSTEDSGRSSPLRANTRCDGAPTPLLSGAAATRHGDATEDCGRADAAATPTPPPREDACDCPAP